MTASEYRRLWLGKLGGEGEARDAPGEKVGGGVGGEDEGFVGIEGEAYEVGSADDE